MGFLLFLVSALIAWGLFVALTRPSEKDKNITPGGASTRRVPTAETLKSAGVPHSARVSGSSSIRPLQSIQLPELSFRTIATDSLPVLEVASFSEPGVHYRVDLHQLTCTCPDFVQNRANLPADSFGRLCKHLSSEILRQENSDTYDDLSRAILKSYSRKASYYGTHLPSGSVVAFGISPGEEWIDVFARKRKKGETAGNCTGEYACYGYSIQRNGWSYGEGPVGAKEIREALRNLIMQ